MTRMRTHLYTNRSSPTSGWGEFRNPCASAYYCLHYVWPQRSILQSGLHPVEPLLRRVHICDWHRLHMAALHREPRPAVGSYVLARLLASCRPSGTECEALGRLAPHHPLDKRRASLVSPIRDANTSIGREIRLRHPLLPILLPLETTRYVTELFINDQMLNLLSGGQRGPLFVVWCVFATNYSLYAGAWVRPYALTKFLFLTDVIGPLDGLVPHAPTRPLSIPSTEPIVHKPHTRKHPVHVPSVSATHSYSTVLLLRYRKSLVNRSFMRRAHA